MSAAGNPDLEELIRYNREASMPTDFVCGACGAGPLERCTWKPSQIPAICVNGVTHYLIHARRQWDFDARMRAL